MAFAVIASTVDGDSKSTVTTDAIDTTGADLIVIEVGWYTAGTTPALSDSKGNTWTGLTARTQGTFRVRMFYCVSPTVGSGHTFTAAGTDSYPEIGVLAVSGVNAADAFDQESAGGGASAATSVQPGSVTPDEANCLVVTGLVSEGSSITINGGYTAISVNNTGGANMGGGIAYLIQSSAAATNPTWSWTGSGTAAAAAAVFHAASGGGGGVVGAQAILSHVAGLGA